MESEELLDLKERVRALEINSQPKCENCGSPIDDPQCWHCPNANHEEMTGRLRLKSKESLSGNNDYAAFLESKRMIARPVGINIADSDLPAYLFDFQNRITGWSARRGRAAVFADCGMGKSPIHLAWSDIVVRHTNKPVLILAPLGVATQTATEEGPKFGVDVKLVDKQPTKIEAAIYITNYEKLDRFDADAFHGIVLDESSILKSLDGKTRTKILQLFQQTPFRLACTATPAPNDHMELGNHAEFLGIMTRAEMLAMFFTHDGGDTSKWRLKGHAAERFWKWVASWAVMVRKPSDLGFEDGAFILPELKFHNHTVESNIQAIGKLFDTGLMSITERRAARRESLPRRVALCAEMVKASNEQFLIWCDLNAEQDALAKTLGDYRAVSIAGSTPDDKRLSMARKWQRGDAQALISKSSIFGFGMNWQHCHNVVYVGIGDSYERFYQSLRRVYRFGQAQPVNCHIIIGEAEGSVLANVQRKEKEAEEMQEGMLEHMKSVGELVQQAKYDEVEYKPQRQMQLPSWL